MALTRKMLKGMGLSDEQIDTIIEAHTEVTSALKDERDRYKAEADKVPALQAEVDAHSGEDPYKKKFEDLTAEYEAYKTEQEKKAERAAKENAYKALLAEAGIPEKRIPAILRVTDLEKIKLNKDGSLSDKDGLLKSARTEWADFVTKESTAGASTETPPTNTGGGKLTRAEIYAKDEFGRYKLSASERQKALAENPDLMMRGN